MKSRKPFLLGILFVSVLFLTACGKYDYDYLNYGRQDTPNMPDSYNGRPVDDQGTIYVSNKNVTFNVWDSGQIDGDIITLVVNDKEVISYYTLTGFKKSVSVTLSNKGYNYVLLYAHNEGSLPPNTAAVSIDDGSGEQTIILSANLSTNGAYNIVVE
jgi:hypothetical protein